MNQEENLSDLVDAKMSKLQKDYLQSEKPVKVSFRQLCSEWPWARRSEAYTHLMHRYPAKIFPYIPIFFLSSETRTPLNSTVLDPFAGTGTVLLESITHPYFKRNAIGVEINPLARLIAKVKTTPLDTTQLATTAEDLNLKIKTFSSKVEIPDFPNRDAWFPRHTQIELSKILACIEEIRDVDVKDFFYACFSSIIREVSLADPKIAPPVFLNPKKFKNKDMRKNVEKLLRRKKYGKPLLNFRKSIGKNIRRLESLNKLTEITSGKVKSEIVWDDARNLKKGNLLEKGIMSKSKAKPIPDTSVGLVITSPPYINAQKYIRTTKFELFWLGLEDEKSIVSLDRSVIGTERVDSKEHEALSTLGISSLDKLIESIHRKDPIKARVVYGYFSDMLLVMKEIYRVLKSDGSFVLVIGDNKIRGINVRTHDILSELATREIGFELESVLVDRIRSRGMITTRHETGGLVLDDWVILLKKGGLK